MIFAPKGESDKTASLKHCLPKGIPMIVIHQKMPENKKPTAKKKPPKISQIMFAIGCLPKSVLTLEPNGQKKSLDSLKHCLPKGMPMIVTHQNRPKRKYPRPDQKPVKISQRRLPIVFMLVPPILILFLNIIISSANVNVNWT